MKITQQFHFPNITLAMTIILFLEDKKSLNIDKRKKRNPALRREYSAVTGVYHVPLGAEEEVVTITPRGKCSLETGKWNSYYFPLAVCKKPGHTWKCLHSTLQSRVSKAQPHYPQKTQIRIQIQVHSFPETSQHWKTSHYRFPYL